MTNKNISGDVN